MHIRRLLVRGGAIVSMDPQIGNYVAGDILIEGKTIVAVAPVIPADNVEVIDASGMIAIPGFVDVHRHAWEGQLRRISPNAATLDAYFAATHDSLAKAYRPHDVYIGNLVTALGCISSGTTCIVDNSHNSRSAEHSNEGIRALLDSGIRAVYASGPPQTGEWNQQWPSDLERLKETYFGSDDGLVTLGMFSQPDASNWVFARRLGLRIYGELVGPYLAGKIDELAVQGYLGPDNTFNHCGGLSAVTWEHLRKAGAFVNVCPRSDSQWALSDGATPLEAALSYGFEPGLSCDNETAYGTDMFGEMRAVFQLARSSAFNHRSLQAESGSTLSTRDVLLFATLNGARCAGLADKIGSLTPGKEADIVLVRVDSLTLHPSHNAFGTVVLAADKGDVDSVIIAGEVRKRHGRVVGVDEQAIRSMVNESCDYLFRTVGYTSDIFADEFMCNAT